MLLNSEKMRPAGHKVLILIIGFLLGLITGGILGSYFWGDTAKNYFIVNNPLRFMDEEKNDTLVLSDEKISEKAKKQDAIQGHSSEQVPANDSLSQFPESLPEGKEAVNTEKEHLTDTLNEDVAGNTDQLGNNDEEPIIVKKDELMFIKNMAVADPVHKTDSLKVKRDSLLQNISGIKEANGNLYVVEFWRSPINYRGYKMGKNKIVFFGMPDSDKQKLIRLNEAVYFKNNDKIYKLEKTVDFKPYELLNDQAILNLLNK